MTMPPAPRSVGLYVVRYGLGVALIAAGIAVVVAFGEEAGSNWPAVALVVGASLLLLKAGVSLVLFGLLHALSVRSDRDRLDGSKFLKEKGVK